MSLRILFEKMIIILNLKFLDELKLALCPTQ